LEGKNLLMNFYSLNDIWNSKVLPLLHFNNKIFHLTYNIILGPINGIKMDARKHNKYNYVCTNMVAFANLANLNKSNLIVNNLMCVGS
jgi:hypothetical protein